MRSKRIILDTNLWISFLISKKLDLLDNYLIKGKFKLIFSHELIDEFLTVVNRPKFKKYFAEENISDLLKFFDKYGELIKVDSKVEKCRDFKDNFLLNLAIDSEANFLITGDSDLLVLKKIKNTKILNWTDFTNEMK